jgi:hypothetical protein
MNITPIDMSKPILEINSTTFDAYQKMNRLSQNIKNSIIYLNIAIIASFFLKNYFLKHHESIDAKINSSFFSSIHETPCEFFINICDAVTFVCFFMQMFLLFRYF